jgi:hypothetical protein
MMTVKWVLLLVTAINRTEFELKPIAEYETMSDCYVASTKLFWENVPMNQELLCMRVGGNDEE